MPAPKYCWVVIQGSSVKGYHLLSRDAFTYYHDATTKAFRAVSKASLPIEPVLCEEEITIWREGLDFVKVLRMRLN